MRTNDVVPRLTGLVKSHPFYSALVVLGFFTGATGSPWLVAPLVVSLFVLAITGFPLLLAFRDALEHARPDLAAASRLTSWEWTIASPQILVTAANPAVRSDPVVGPLASRYVARFYGAWLVFIALVVGSMIGKL